MSCPLTLALREREVEIGRNRNLLYFKKAKINLLVAVPYPTLESHREEKGIPFFIYQVLRGKSSQAHVQGQKGLRPRRSLDGLGVLEHFLAHPVRDQLFTLLVLEGPPKNCKSSLLPPAISKQESGFWLLPFLKWRAQQTDTCLLCALIGT